MAMITTSRLLSNRSRRVMLIGLVLVAFYLLAVTPARTYFEQRQEMAEATARYNTLIAANKGLEEQVSGLANDDRIAQLARERYELVPPNTDAYAVMPPAQAVVPEANAPEQSSWEKARDTLSFWD